MRSYLARVKETELFLKSMEAEEESLERNRKQLFLFNNLLLGSKFGLRLNGDAGADLGARSAPVRSNCAHEAAASNGFIGSAALSFEPTYTIPSCARPNYLSRGFEPSLGSQAPAKADLSRTYDAQADFRARRSRSQLGDQFHERRPRQRPSSGHFDSSPARQYLASRGARSASQVRYQPSQRSFRVLGAEQSFAPSVSEYRSAFRAPAERTSNCSSPLISADADSDDGMSDYRVSSYVPRLDFGRKLEPAEHLSASKAATSGAPSRARRNSLQSEPTGADPEPTRRRLSLVADSPQSEPENGSRLSQLEQRIAENRKRREELLSGRSSPRPAECSPKLREQPSAGNTLARPSRLESMEARIKRRSYCASVHNKAADSTLSLEKWRPAQVSSARGSTVGLDYGLLSQLSVGRNKKQSDEQSD